MYIKNVHVLNWSDIGVCIITYTVIWQQHVDELTLKIYVATQVGDFGSNVPLVNTTSSSFDET